MPPSRSAPARAAHRRRPRRWWQTSCTGAAAALQRARRDRSRAARTAPGAAAQLVVAAALIPRDGGSSGQRRREHGMGEEIDRGPSSLSAVQDHLRTLRGSFGGGDLAAGEHRRGLHPPFFVRRRLRAGDSFRRLEFRGPRVPPPRRERISENREKIAVHRRHHRETGLLRALLLSAKRRDRGELLLNASVRHRDERVRFSSSTVAVSKISPINLGLSHQQLRLPTRSTEKLLACLK